MSLRLRQPPTGVRREAWERIAGELAARGIETDAGDAARARLRARPRRRAQGRAGDRRSLNRAPASAGRGLEQARADRAAEVAERGDEHRRRAVVVEEVRQHRRGDAVGVGLAEPHAEPAAEDHGLDVEHVDDRRDAGAERLDGVAR